MALFETIKYKRIKKDKKIEIRQYNDILLASTKSKINISLDSRFNDVFRYISGSNDLSAKISMTSPVVTYQEDDLLVTRFYVPSKYTKETISKPTEKSAFINELKNSYYAVIRFSGNWTKDNFDKHDKVLLEYMKLNDYVRLSSRIIMHYQPPIIPGIFRHNEIAYQIDYKI
jgi:hypothetical protein